MHNGGQKAFPVVILLNPCSKAVIGRHRQCEKAFKNIIHFDLFDIILPPQAVDL